MILKQAVAHTESNDNQYALRFEREVYLNINIKKATRLLNFISACNNCNFETAKMIYSTSWGKYQIMGFNLYSICNFKKSIFDFINYHSTQDTAFYTFLRVRGIDYNKTEEDLIALTKERNKIYDNSPTIKDFTENFKTFIQNKKEFYINLFNFVTRYNGSKFCSDNFYAYILRLTYFTNKLLRGEIK